MKITQIFKGKKFVKKVPSDIDIKSKEEIEQLMKRRSELELEHQTLETKAEEKIQAIKESYEADIQPVKDEIEVIEKALESYSSSHFNEVFGKSKRLNTRYGFIGYRKVKSVNFSRPEQEIIADLKKKNLRDAIGYRDPYVLKKVVEKYSPVRLQRLGITVDEDDKFQVKPDVESVK